MALQNVRTVAVDQEANSCTTANTFAVLLQSRFHDGCNQFRLSITSGIPSSDHECTPNESTSSLCVVTTTPSSNNDVR